MTCCFNPFFQSHVLILYLDASFTCALSVTHIILFLLNFIFRLLVIASRLEDTTTRLRRALANLLPQRSCKRVDFACVWRSSYFEKVISTIARSTAFEGLAAALRAQELAHWLLTTSTIARWSFLMFTKHVFFCFFR